MLNKNNRKNIVAKKREQESKKLELEQSFNEIRSLFREEVLNNSQKLEEIIYATEELLKEQHLNGYLKFEVLHMKLSVQMQIRDIDRSTLDKDSKFQSDLIEIIELHKECKHQIPKRARDLYEVTPFCRELFKIFKNREDLLNAEKYLYKIPEREQSSIKWLELKAVLLIDQLKYNEAVNILENILNSEEGKKYENYCNMAYVQSNSCNYNSAKKSLNRALELNNESAHVKLLLINTHILSNELEEAKRLIDLIPSEQRNFVFYKNFADYYKGIYDDIKQELMLKVSIKKMDNNKEGTILNQINCNSDLLLLYMRQGRVEDYNQLYESLEKRFNQYPSFLFIKLQYTFINKGPEECTSIIERAKGLFPSNIEVLKFEIHNCFAEKKYHEVLNLYEKFVRIYPNDTSIYDDVGKSYLALGRYEYAEEYLFKLYNIYPNRKDIRVDLGNYYYHKKDYFKSLEYYLNEIELFSEQKNNTKLLNNIAAAYYLLQEYEKSLKYIDKALELDLLNHNLYIHKGLILLNQNNPNLAEARNCFYEAILINPQSFTKVEQYLNKIEEEIQADQCIAESEGYIDNERNKSLSKVSNKNIHNFTTQDKNIEIQQTKFSEFKLYKTESEFEKIRKSKFNNKTPQGKIWGEDFPAVEDKSIYPLVWKGSDIEKTKTFGFIDKNSKAIMRLEDNVLSKSEFTLEKGKFTSSVKNQQGVKLYQNSAKIKNLGAEGSGDIRIVGKRIKDKIFGYSLYVFSEVEKKHGRA